MRIISFITEAGTIKQIVDHVGIRPPADRPSRAPPRMVQGQFVDTPFSDDELIDPQSSNVDCVALSRHGLVM